MKKKIDNIIFTVTQLCNYKCVMCRCWESKWSKDCLTDEQLINSIKEFSEIYDVKDIILTGGEPLLRKNLLDIIKTCKKVGFNVTLTTNGSLLNKNNIPKLIDTGLDVFSLSLDSLNPETHDEIRGVKGAYDNVMQVIDTISKIDKKIHLSLVCTIMKHNIDEVPDMVEWVHNNKTVESISFQVLSTPPNYSKPNNWMNDDEFKDLVVTDKTKVNYVFPKLISYRIKDMKSGIVIDSYGFFGTIC